MKILIFGRKVIRSIPGTITRSENEYGNRMDEIEDEFNRETLADLIGAQRLKGL